MKEKMYDVFSVVLWLVVFILASTAILYCSITEAEEISLVWDANTEPDLAGYRLYESDTPGPPYKRVEINGQEVSIPAGTEIVTIETYGSIKYYVLTAYDTEGLESGYSNEVEYKAPYVDVPPEAPKGLLKKIIDAISNFFKGWYKKILS